MVDLAARLGNALLRYGLLGDGLAECRAADGTFAEAVGQAYVVAPNMACQVIDWAMQVHGGAGMCGDFPLAYFYTMARTLRFADGPDEVHRNAIAKIELGKLGPR